MTHLLTKTSSHLTVPDAYRIAHSTQSIELSTEVRAQIQHCRTFLENLLSKNNKAYYGINTGFGDLCNVVIPDADLNALQVNLVRSHACGAGARVEPELVRIMLLLKIMSLSQGFSGVRVEVVQMLVELFNSNLTPEVMELGSLGASGDLAPLAHISLVLMGEGKVYHQGHYVPAMEVLSSRKMKPLSLQAKEGLALLNGTQFMGAFGVYCLHHSHRIYELANQIGVLSALAFNADVQPFSAAIHAIRPHRGQELVGAYFYEEITEARPHGFTRYSVQDPYSFRCIPQVHGASWQAIDHVEGIFETEINSVTDNPNIFPEEGVVLNGGNFHGQPLAMAFDYLAIALAELGSISERRVFQLISGERGLPPFLAEQPGIESGLMITQYLAAGIVSQNKQLCCPASVDSIPSSNGQEDHVSMGANAAVKSKQVVENVYRLLAIELICACRALRLRGILLAESKSSRFKSNFLAHVAIPSHDAVWSGVIEETVAYLKSVELETPQK